MISSTLPPSLPTPAPDREAQRIVAWCLNGAERDFAGRITGLGNWPTQDQRAVMLARHKVLARHMGERNDSTIADAVTALIGCYRNALKPGEDVRPVTAKYVKELHGLPTWACVRACDAIRDNKYPDCITFLPSTIRLREIAASYTETVTREATELFHVLRAERLPAPVSEAERERIAVGFQKLSDDLRRWPDKPRFGLYTDDELRAMYAKPPPATDSEMCHVKQSEAAE